MDTLPLSILHDNYSSLLLVQFTPSISQISKAILAKLHQRPFATKIDDDEAIYVSSIFHT